jgi:hypothetical protein
MDACQKCGATVPDGKGHLYMIPAWMPLGPRILRKLSFSTQVFLCDRCYNAQRTLDRLTITVFATLLLLFVAYTLVLFFLVPL